MEDDLILRLAADRKNGPLLQLAIAAGCDIHSNNDYALRILSHHGNVDLVKMLIDQGADITANRFEAIRWSIVAGRVPVFTYLLNQVQVPASILEEFLLVAVVYGRTMIVKQLLGQCSPQNVQELLLIAVQSSYTDIVMVFADGGYRVTDQLTIDLLKDQGYYSVLRKVVNLHKSV